MKTDADYIANHLVEILREKNLTINRLATLSGVGQSTLNALFDGSSKRPTVTTIRKICPVLDMSFHEFFDFPPYNEVEK